MMEKNNKLALYIGYFLARFNRQAYDALGFGTQKETHFRIGKSLGVKPSTIQNMRDEFDPLFEHRAGWYQRALSPSRVQVVEVLENHSFEQINRIVSNILADDDESTLEILSEIINDDRIGRLQPEYTTRGVTGKKAEEIFEQNYLKIIPSFDGELINTSADGSGFDFKNSLQSKFIEVKGSINEQLGILLTDKEWEAAKKLEDKYFLVLIYNLGDEPKFKVVKNPASFLNPKLSIQRTISLNWNVPHSQLTELKNEPYN